MYQYEVSFPTGRDRPPLRPAEEAARAAEIEVLCRHEIELFGQINSDGVDPS